MKEIEIAFGPQEAWKVSDYSCHCLPLRLLMAGDSPTQMGRMCGEEDCLTQSEEGSQPFWRLTNPMGSAHSDLSEIKKAGTNEMDFCSSVQASSTAQAMRPHSRVLYLSDRWWVHPVQWHHHLKCSRDGLVMLSETDQRRFLLLVTLGIRFSSG